MRYANGGDHLHRLQAMQLYEVLPLELIDRSQGIDTVYWLQIPLTFEQSRDRYRPLRNFDSMEFRGSLSHRSWGDDLWDSSCAGTWLYFSDISS
jgi:hypothetical protein